MRPGPLVLVLILGLVLATATKARNYSHFSKQRGRLREIRGFKPEYISTAIGFGKRQDDRSTGSRRDRILYTLLQNSPRGLSLDWLLREMKTNPGLAGRLTRLLVLDQGQDSSTDEGRTPFSF